MNLELVEGLVFKLGKVVFKLSGLDPNLARQLENTISIASPEDIASASIIQIDASNKKHVGEIVDLVLKEHQSCFWVDASCLLSPTGKKVLLSGRTHSGKSTLSLALILAHGWQALAEDVTLVEPDSKEILNFAAPMLLREGTLKHIAEVTDAVPKKVVSDSWVPLMTIADKSNRTAPFDLAVHLQLKSEPDDEGGFTWTRIQPSDFARRIMPISNLLTLKNGMNSFFDFVKSEQCFLCTNGSVSDRVNKLVDLSK